MHDVVLGFVCFTAGVFFVVAVGFIALGRGLLGDPAERLDHAPSVNDGPPMEPGRQAHEPERLPWRGGPDDPHPAWPECDCPSEAFHTKYYPAAGVKS
ncbi:MAG TPA: hypothetical protein VFI18_07300 [Gaiellales bacterium]|nr:hypothetical protein [Gaiellales bacterium]